MALQYYQNYLDNLAQTPNEYFQDGVQALVDSVWDNSTQTEFEIYQQNGIGSIDYTQTNISVDMSIEMGTGLKQSDDFKIFSHKNLKQLTLLGLMYQWEQNYWITVNTSEIGSPTKSAGVRRCNNIAKWIDPDNGFIYEIPCVIEYDVTGTQPLKNKDDVTDNGHFVLIIQGNQNTFKIKKNQRFIFNGEAYKLTGYNTMLQNGAVDKNTTLFYFDLYVDVIHQATDDLINGIANRFEYNYQINILNGITEQVNGFIGNIFPEITFNGDIVKRQLAWVVNEFVSIEADGTYTLNGNVGDVATIRAELASNSNIYDEISITITDAVIDEYAIDITPLYKEVRQKQSINFDVYLFKNGVKQNDTISFLVSGLDKSYYTLTENNHTFTLTALKFNSIPLNITFTGGETSRSVDIYLKSLF